MLNEMLSDLLTVFYSFWILTGIASHFQQKNPTKNDFFSYYAGNFLIQR